MKKKDIKKAVALGYEADRLAAPKVKATGKGRVAEKIIETAKKNDVPIHEDADLVEVLSHLNLDSEIPPDLYHAVAEVLAFIYRVNEKAGKKIELP